MDKLYTALGLMSGTSLDGIDASILTSDGENIIKIERNIYESYESNLKKDLNNYINNIQEFDDIKNSKAEYIDLEKKITIKHIEISKKIISDYKKNVDIVGFHGQTILHRPEEKCSIQMGDANLLSSLLKVRVIHNFRKKDIENNGNGAPLSPIYHLKLSNEIGLKKPCIFLNIGGISNLTYIEENKIKAKDIGPGNVLIDEYMKIKKKGNYDKDGQCASQGRIDHNLVNQFIEHEIYNTKKKHSLNRGDFDISFVRALTFENAIATLTYFTAKLITNRIIQNYNKNIDIVVCGGGRKNNTLIKHIENNLEKKIFKIDEFGIDGDFIESQAFGYLAIRSLLKKNITFPDTTKVLIPCTGGEVVKNY